MIDPTAIVSPNIRVRYPELLTVGAGSVVDDYCYLSAAVTIGRYCHVANNVSVGGGRAWRLVLGDFSGISAGARIWCSSNDFVREILTVFPVELGAISDASISGDVVFDRFTGVGSNAVVMPNNEVPEGVAIGALSFVPSRYRFKPWTIYAGVPIRPVLPRDREAVLRQHDRAERAVRAARA